MGQQLVGWWPGWLCRDMQTETKEYTTYTRITVLQIKDRVVCPNFGHPALTPSFRKYKFFQVKNTFATLMNVYFQF